MSKANSNTKGRIICDVVDVSGDGYEFKEAQIDLQEGAVALGKPITKPAADKMIDDYVKEVMGRFDNDASKYNDQIVAVQFGKEEILYLLSNMECVSLIFYFCKNHEGVHSLAVIPLDGKNGQIIRPATLSSKAPAQIVGSEVGGGTTIRQFLQANLNQDIGDYKLYL